MYERPNRHVINDYNNKNTEIMQENNRNRLVILFQEMRKWIYKWRIDHKNGQYTTHQHKLIPRQYQTYS